MSNSLHRKALQLILQNDWNAAHKIVQNLSDPNASLIHAYLHRLEGDTNNADYWYKKAGQQMPSLSVSEELDLLISRLE